MMGEQRPLHVCNDCPTFDETIQEICRYVAKLARTRFAKAFRLAHCWLFVGGLRHLGHHILRHQSRHRRHAAFLSHRLALPRGRRTVDGLAGIARPTHAHVQTVAGSRLAGISHLPHSFKSRIRLGRSSILLPSTPPREDARRALHFVLAPCQLYGPNIHSYIAPFLACQA